MAPAASPSRVRPGSTRRSARWERPRERRAAGWPRGRPERGRARGRGGARAGLGAGAGGAGVVPGRGGDRLERTAKDLQATGALIATVVADVAKREDCERLVDTTKERFGRLDVLVNNAGITRDG